MLVIGEKINGMFKSVERAIAAKDTKVIQDLAVKHVELGTDILDVCTGPGVDNADEVMKWMVESVQDVVEVPLCVDSPDPKVIEAGIKACAKKPIINSATAEDAKMQSLFPLARDYTADIICLTLEKGIPNDANARCEFAMKIVTTAMEYDIMPERIYLDPLVLPVCAAQDQTNKVMESLDMFKTLADPAPKTVVGLSNISNGTTERPLLNRITAVMLMAHGLSAAIMNPEDKELMEAIKTGEIILNEELYCDGFLKTK